MEKEKERRTEGGEGSFKRSLAWNAQVFQVREAVEGA
jgi:hypothetical protein